QVEARGMNRTGSPRVLPELHGHPVVVQGDEVPAHVNHGHPRGYILKKGVRRVSSRVGDSGAIGDVAVEGDLVLARAVFGCPRRGPAEQRPVVADEGPERGACARISLRPLRPRLTLRSLWARLALRPLRAGRPLRSLGSGVALVALHT